MEDNKSFASAKAKETIDRYAAFTPNGETTLADAERMIVNKEWWDHIGEAMETLSHALNGSNPKEVAQAMFIKVAHDHRTLQAQTIAAFIEFMSIYKDAAYDLRNKAAVDAATKITQFAKDANLYIPLI